MGPPLTWPCSARIGDAQEGGRKTQMPQQPAASRPGAVQHVLLPGVRAGTGAQGGAQAPAGAPLQHTALRKKTSEEVFSFLHPKTNPIGALTRAVRNGGTHERLARETVSGTEDQRTDIPRMAHDR